MKTILITGGSSGIGLAVAKQLILSPHRLILLGQSPQKLSRAQSELLTLAHPDTVVEAVAVSVTSFESLGEQLRDVLPHLDVVIHCAGLGLAKKFEETGLDEFTRLMDTNFKGAMHVVRLVLPAMKQKRQGRLILVSSAAALLGIYGYTAYSASKFAVEGFAQSLRNELIGSGVSLGVVYPPDVDTPMLAAENETKPDVTKAISGGVLMQPEAVAAHIISHIPRKSFRIIPGFWNRVNCFLMAHFPRLAFAVIDRTAAKHHSSALKTRA